VIDPREAPKVTGPWKDQLVSVVLPVYNERAALRESVLELINKMKTTGHPFEVILVDDCSSDGCLDTVRDLDVTVVRHLRREGGGVARMTGLYFAKGELVVQSDADSTYPVDELPAMLAELEHADMIIAARRKESAVDFHLLRVLMKSILQRIAEYLSAQRIPDLNSGMRLYRKTHAVHYAHLYPTGHSIMSTMTLAFLYDRRRVVFHPIDYRVRKGKSSFHPIRDTYNYLFTILRAVTLFEPLRFFVPLASASALLAVPFFLRDLYREGLGPTTAVLILGSLVFLAVGLLADSITRMNRKIQLVTFGLPLRQETMTAVAVGFPDAAPGTGTGPIALPSAPSAKPPS
jgi:glycosyltransferase involved in cell wall biosynthesis